MQPARALPVLLALLLAGACRSAGGGAKPAATVEAELLQVDRDFCAVAQRMPIGEAFRAFLAEESTSMPLGRPFVHGRDAIAKSLSNGPAGEKLSWTPMRASVAAGGDLGYTYGTWEYEAGGNVRRGKYVTIWRRQEDGGWKAVFDGGNTLDDAD